MNFCKPGKSWLSRNSINKKNVAPQRSGVMMVNKILSISWSLGHPSMNKETWAKRIVGSIYPYSIFIWTKVSHKLGSRLISLYSNKLWASGVVARQLLGQSWSNSELESNFLVPGLCYLIVLINNWLIISTISFPFSLMFCF